MGPESHSLEYIQHDARILDGDAWGLDGGKQVLTFELEEKSVP